MKIILTKEESEKILDTLLFKEIKAKLLNTGIVPEVSVEVAVDAVTPKAINGYPVGVKMKNISTLNYCPEGLCGCWVRVWINNHESVFYYGFADDWNDPWDVTRHVHISHFMILEDQKPSL